MNNIIDIILVVLLVIIVALQLLNVAGVSQRAINLVYGIILIAIVVANSGWLHV